MPVPFYFIWPSSPSSYNQAIKALAPPGILSYFVPPFCCFVPTFRAFDPRRFLDPYYVPQGQHPEVPGVQLPQGQQQEGPRVLPPP
jgi:hypothetical protein